ncbi:MAG: 4Fe-4S dicluster domain-containing protein, partial [Deltaproteobacteria bacterium]|nr:4Fe-4S dicluster domain-containing protein [Deltaproteobacteria bacterium]
MLVTGRGLDRRGLLRLLAGRAAPWSRDQEAVGAPRFQRPLRPPGAVAEPRLRQFCDGCGACTEACPYGSIRIERGLPMLRLQTSPCYLCPDFPCIRACPRGALRPVAGPRAVRIGRARLDRHACLAWDGGDCRLCLARCPLSGEALVLEDFKPAVASERCVG